MLAPHGVTAVCQNMRRAVAIDAFSLPSHIVMTMTRGCALGQGNEFRLTPGIGVGMPCDFHRLDRHLLPPRTLLRHSSESKLHAGRVPPRRDATGRIYFARRNAILLTSTRCPEYSY